MSSVFSESVCELLLSLISIYMRMELKGQRASSKSLQSGILRQDFPYSKLKCMRGLITEEELTRVITQVIQGEKSISDMEKEFTRLKDMRALQNFFLKSTNCKSWEEARER